MARPNVRAHEKPVSSFQPTAKRLRRDDNASSSSDSSDASDSSDSSDSEASDSSSSSSSSGSSDSSSSSSTSSSDEDEGEEAPPPGVAHYTPASPPTGELHWYWTQRHRLFSRYTAGIWMTPTSWFEVTPERIASKIAIHMFPSSRHLGGAPVVVLDAFCGVGGNSIQFALSPHVSRVIALDTSRAAIACARHNAGIYGVAGKIEFVCGDFFTTDLSAAGVGAVFLSPPWGGPKYRDDEVFDLEGMQPYGARALMARAREVTRNVALYVPRTSDMNQLAALLEGDGEMEAVHYCLQRKSKAITAYFGNLNSAVKMARVGGWKD